MRIHCVQHVAFEDAGLIDVWARDRGAARATTCLHQGQALPPHDAYDWLVVLGGPMSVRDADRIDWMPREKQHIREAIEAGKTVLGICLGAQLIADVLGARVYPAERPEIGWFPVTLSEDGARSPLFDGFPPTFDAFHWHGETFDLPAAGTHLASSAVCRNQAFSYADGRVLALQFHLESDARSIRSLLVHAGQDLEEGPTVQTHGTMLSRLDARKQAESLLRRLLDRLAERCRC